MLTMASIGSRAVFLHALLVVVATAEYYVPPPTTYISTDLTPFVPNPNPDIAIEGFILCKYGYKGIYPIQGAKVKVVCPIVDSEGKLVAKISISSYPTDSNGYFYFITYGLSHKVTDINGCKVKLESSPDSTCKTPTNVNKGVIGAPVSSDNSKFLDPNNLNIYTLEPFYFSSSLAPRPVY